MQGRAPRLLESDMGVGGMGREAGATVALQDCVAEGLENAPGREQPFALNMLMAARGVRMAMKGSLCGRG